MVPRYITELAKKFNPQIKVHFFDTKVVISTIGFAVTFKLTCDINQIQEGAAMRKRPHYVNDTLTNALNRNVCSEVKSPLIFASVRDNDAKSGKLY